MLPLSQRRQFKHFLLLGILFGAAVLRILGSYWGMPYIFHPDERFMISRGVHFFTLDFNPHLFIYPSLLMYILFVVNVIVYVLGWISGHFESILTFTALYQSDPAVFYVPNRLVIALFGVLTVLFTYKLARLRFSHSIALMAATLLAVLPVHVLHSHFVTTDVPCVLFVVISLYYAAKILYSTEIKNYLLAALFAGLAAGIKYNGGAVVLCMVVAHALREWEAFDGSLWQRMWHAIKSCFNFKVILACFFSLVVFIASSPFVVLDFNSFLREFVFQVSVQRRGHGLIFVGIDHKLLYEIFVVFRNWGGPLLLLGIFIGIIRSFLTLEPFKVLMLFWSGLYFIALLSSNDFFIRYTLLIIPPLLILTAELFVWALSRSRWMKWISGFLILILGTFMLSYSIIIVSRLVAEDPRITAKTWLERVVQDQERVGIMISSTGMQHHDDPPNDMERYEIIADKSLLNLLQESPEWLVISRYDYVDFMRLGERYDFARPTFLALKDLRTGKLNYDRISIFDNTPKLFGINLLGRFPIHDMMYTFPRIEIYRKRK